MSRARDLSKLGNPNIIKADENSVGFGTQVAGNPANASSSLISAGIVTAAQFFGDGSNLEGVASAGLGTAVDDTKDSIGQNIYFTNAELSINANTTVNAPDSSNIAYTQYQQVTVESGSELIIADGDSFIPDVLGIGTALQASTAGAGNGIFGTVFVDNIENAAGRGGPNFPLGITVAGVSTLSGNVSIGGTLTYEDVTNVDSIGVVTARSGIKVTGGGIDVTAGNIDISSGGVNILADNKYLKIGAGGDLQLVHTGGETFITNSTGHLTHRSDVHKWENYAGGSEYLRLGTAGQIGIAGANYGTSGQVLTSQGSGSAVQWADAGGAMDIIKSVDLGTDYGQNYVDFTGITTSSGYLRYQLVFSNVQLVDNSAEVFAVRFYRGSTGALGTGSYYYYNTKKSSIGSNSITQEGTTSDAWKLLGTSNNDRANWSGKVEWAHTTDPANKLWPPVARMLVDNGEMWYSIGYDACKLTNTNSEWISGIRFMNYGSGDNLSDGRITLYGLKFS